MLATLRAHPLQLGESRVHGCCTHIQLKCKHRALKNSDPKTPSAPKMPSPTTETGGADTHFHPESFLRKKCSQMLVQGSPTQWGILSPEGISACSPKTFPPLAEWELLAFYSSISQASAWSASMIQKANSWATKRTHIFWVSELCHLPFTPCGIQILSEPGQTQRADDCSVDLENSLSFPNRNLEMGDLINSPPLSVKEVKLLQIVSWVPSNTESEEDLLKASRNSSN